MNHTLEISVGSETWQIALLPGKLIDTPGASTNGTGSVREQVSRALEHPYEFEAMRRALTPEDRVVILLDESLPHVGEALVAVLEHLASAGISAEAVTLLTPPTQTASSWIDELPDEFADVRTEVHDPNDRKNIAYLANTKSERRVYLNRGLVESDFVLILSARRHNAGPETLLYPRFSDAESLQRGPVKREEATEVAMLLGSTFFVQCIEDGRGGLLEVVAGLSNSVGEGVRRHDLHWRVKLTERPDTVVACVAGESPSFAAYASAAYRASKLVPDGRVCLLGNSWSDDSEGVRLLRHCDEPKDALKLLEKAEIPEKLSCQQWAKAASRTKLYLANVSDDEAEELWAFRIGNVRELQNLLETSERVLYLPHADRTIVELP